MNKKLNFLICMFVNTCFVIAQTNIHNSHEYVDLGLPSGVMWATCNLGAITPEHHGSYYSWGETETKDFYGWENYIWGNGAYNSQTKYCTSKKYGKVDKKKHP